MDPDSASEGTGRSWRNAARRLPKAQAERHGALSLLAVGGLRPLTHQQSPIALPPHYFTPFFVLAWLSGRWPRLAGVLKVNPIGAPRAPTSHALVHEVVAGLKSAGVPAKDVIVFSRYRTPFIRAGYVDHLPDGARWEAAAEDYDNVQLGIDGYDPDVYREMDLVSVRFQDPNDERARRSHLCLVVSRMVNKVINLT